MTSLPHCLHFFLLKYFSQVNTQTYGARLLSVRFSKSGYPHQPNNYRGISLLCTLSEIFTKIINSRLVKWADENEKRQEKQAGYRKRL